MLSCFWLEIFLACASISSINPVGLFAQFAYVAVCIFSLIPNPPLLTEK